MAGKTGAPAPEYVHNAARGEHQIGVRFNGYFVPFASLSDARVAQLAENAKELADAADTTTEDGE